MIGGKSNSTSAPKIANLSIQTSALGLCIPLGWGTNRVKCNPIWYGAFRAIAHTEKTGGGKGNDDEADVAAPARKTSARSRNGS